MSDSPSGGAAARIPLGHTGLALGACVLLVSCGPAQDSSRDAESGDGPERMLVAGDLMGRFPVEVAGTTGPVLESARGLVVAGDRFYVLDGMARRVLSFDLDGGLVGDPIGRPGGGPGELTAPMSLAVAPDGHVWIAEPAVGTLSRFEPAGPMVGEYRTPYPPVNFGIGHDGSPLVPTLSARTLLARVAEDGTVDIPIPPEVIPVELTRGPGDRLSLGGLLLTGLPDGSIALLRNRHGSDFRLWRVIFDQEGSRITDVIPVRLPRWLHAMLDEETEAVRKTVPPAFATGEFMVPFKGMHLAGSRLWLVPSPSSRLIALSVWPGERVGVTGARDVYRGLVDAAVSGDRLIALYDTEVRVYRLGESRETRPSH